MTRRRHLAAWDAPRAGIGGVLLLGSGIVIGFEIADFVDRRVAGLAPTDKLPTTGIDKSITTTDQYNDYAVSSKPSFTRLAWQAGIAVVGFVGGAFAPWPVVKMLMYGVGLGATAHAVHQVVVAWIIEPMFVDAQGKLTDTGREMYAHEYTSYAKLNPATGTTAGPGSLGAPNYGHPHAVAAAPHNPALPAAQHGTRVPIALANFERRAPQPAAHQGALGANVQPQPQPIQFGGQRGWFVPWPQGQREGGGPMPPQPNGGGGVQPQGGNVPPKFEPPPPGLQGGGGKPQPRPMPPQTNGGGQPPAPAPQPPSTCQPGCACMACMGNVDNMGTSTYGAPPEADRPKKHNPMMMALLTGPTMRRRAA